MWKWDDALGNKWARVAMCSQRLNIPINMPEDIKEERRGTSWARATRELRRLRHRIEAVGGSEGRFDVAAGGLVVDGAEVGEGFVGLAGEPRFHQ